MATLATNVSFQCFGLDGKPLAGGKVYTYSAGTTTSKATYTTMAGTVANPNPVILDQNGKAKIFLGDDSYRLQIKDSNDALIDDIDQISRYVTQSEFATFQQTVNDGVTQLTEVREQIDVFVNTSIGNQKGFANGIAPLDANVKVDPIYLPSLPNTAIPQATETVVGVAKLANTLNSTDDKAALTAAQGKVLNNQAFGVGQTWQDVSGSRSKNVTYTNTTGKPINVAVIAGYSDSDGGLQALVGGVTVEELYGKAPSGSGYWKGTLNFTVPHSSTYRIEGGSNVLRWVELR